jgi:hypothetical protein
VSGERGEAHDQYGTCRATTTPVHVTSASLGGPAYQTYIQPAPSNQQNNSSGCGFLGLNCAAHFLKNLSAGAINGITSIFTAPAANVAAGYSQAAGGLACGSYTAACDPNQGAGLAARFQQLGAHPIPLGNPHSGAYKGGYYGAPLLLGGAGAAAKLGETLAAEDVGLSTRGLTPAAGTRIPPEGIPENWRIVGTKSPGGVRYYDPSNPGNSVRVMQGNPNSPYPTSRSPYVRWQQNGQPLDVFGNKLPSANDPAAHIPLEDFNFMPELFR